MSSKAARTFIWKQKYRACTLQRSSGFWVRLLKRPGGSLEDPGGRGLDCQEQGVDGFLLIGRPGLCKPLFTMHVLSPDASDFNHSHNQSYIGIKCHLGDFSLKVHSEDAIWLTEYAPKTSSGSVISPPLVPGCTYSKIYMTIIGGCWGVNKKKKDKGKRTVNFCVYRSVRIGESQVLL